MWTAVPPVGLENGAIIVELNQVPNQPIQFADEDFGRVEDAFLAKTWDLFYRTRDPYIVGRMPMVKAAVRAMDAISEFVASYLPSTITPERYVLAGGSKRGWSARPVSNHRHVTNTPLFAGILAGSRGLLPPLITVSSAPRRW